MGENHLFTARRSLLGTGKHYHIETFGCQMNVRDSETAAGVFEQMGYTHTEDKAEADLLLLNTCCVRDHAEQRVFGNVGALLELKQAKPDLIICVCGCMMQQKKVAERLYRRFPFVDVVCGTNLLARLSSFVAEAYSGNRVLAFGEDTIIEDNLPFVPTGVINAFVNINYGCDNFCTYCIVPYVRGRERSRTPDAVTGEVSRLVACGYSEITLLGQNVNSYGKEFDQIDFAYLLGRVSEIDGLKRIRFMTSHPKDLSDRMIQAMATLEKVCHHVHLPMQSGSNRILKAMNRRYTREDYLTIVEKLRTAMPDVELTTDIIVGFPGETEEDFLETLDLVEKVGFSCAFTFMYSPRAGTKAATMENQIDEEIKHERLMRLNALQERKSFENNEKYVGSSAIVHVDDCTEHDDVMLCCGKTANFKMIYFPGKTEWIDRYMRVTIDSVRNHSLMGTAEDESID